MINRIKAKDQKLKIVNPDVKSGRKRKTKNHGNTEFYYRFKKDSPHTLHEHARFMRKLVIFLVVESVKLFVCMGLKFFIFLVDSKIVHAHLMLSGQGGSR